MYQICKATESELPRILQIYAEARDFMRRSGNPNQWKTHHPATQLLLEDIARQQLYLCMEGNEIQAVFAYIPGIDPTYLHIYEGQWCNDAPYGVIHRIAVARQGRGVAAACFDWALEQCRNLRIDTHRDNLPMQRALDKYGFRYCGIIYLQNGEERLAFQKTV